MAKTKTDFSNPSGPKTSSTNSLASRPRSPIKPITAISESVFLAIIDIKVDLPTPEPAKIPIRCPLHTVKKVLTALTPKSTFPFTRLRNCAGGGALFIK